ncbi:class F sortase [Agromyces bauzanensis]|uniref:class F sortase n=1 Tax=Agromyces bauzanensis TaxID=1308924 RepID=UPI0016650D04|nr:class F sortase [Agromyces bauzanensis]
MGGPAAGPSSSEAPAVSAPPSPQAAVPDIPRSSAALSDRPPLAAPAPVRLVVPDLGIDVPVEAVGLDDQGRMGLPANPAVAAWYRFGSAPGSATGSTAIAAAEPLDGEPAQSGDSIVRGELHEDDGGLNAGVRRRDPAASPVA